MFLFSVVDFDEVEASHSDKPQLHLESELSSSLAFLVEYGVCFATTLSHLEVVEDSSFLML